MANRWICLSDREISALYSCGAALIGNYERRDILISALNKLHRSQKRIQISSAKGKGRSLQQNICKRISELIKIEYNQQDDQCLIHSREMGQSGVDIILRGEAQKRFPFSIECKSTETISLPSWIRQAQSNAQGENNWMVVFKSKQFSEPILIMEWKGFENMIRIYLEGERQ